MHKRLDKYLSINNLLCNHQFGFKKGLCTSDALAEFVDIAYDAINASAKFIAIYLDFSKAFDTVNIEILLAKLYHMGVRGNIHCWFRSFLSERRHFVAIGKEISSEFVSSLGVPQGAVLAPLLFLIYVNDMFKSCPKLEIIHYADDTTAFIRGDNLTYLQTIINTELNSINTWLQCNRLTLNIQKSSYMVFSHEEALLNIIISNINLVKVEKIKFLGVIFDVKLSFKFHYEELLSKLSRVVGISYKSRYLVPEAVLRTLYLSLGWSHMSYGVVIWGMANQTYRNKLQLLQNRIIKNIYASNNLSVYKRNGLLRFMVYLVSLITLPQ